MKHSFRKAFMFVLTLLALTFSALGLPVTPARAATLQFDISGPAGSGNFGSTVTTLPNGNIVVTDPLYDAPGPIADVGAVYLYNGATHALISTLTGSTANNQVGSNGVTVLTNGNYVVSSYIWDGAAVDTGAVTWGSGTTGITGVVSASNSLVGSKANDNIGSTGVTALTNGNYVVGSANWDGAAANVGAVTWGSGTTGITGVVSASNSLVGSTAGDQVGVGLFFSGVRALTNGNYLVSSPGWNGGKGAVTWGSGTAGITGVVSAANSLVGFTANDQVGDVLGVTALTNGNYVVGSPNWDGAAVDVGAVTWGSGTAGITGVVSAANSLVGSKANDQVGDVLGVTALTNGNYVVVSSSWDGVVANVGAVTWGSGTTGITGVVSAANSLVGSKTNDNIGFNGVTALTNGNYVVRSPFWNGTAVDVGAVTWGSGTTGITGTVTASNSLVGFTAGDQVGSIVTALTNGNYVVSSGNWDGAAVDTGAATWGSGTTGIAGEVSASNSLVGSTASDQVGSFGVTALTNGNYVVGSANWDGAAVDVGAATWGSGTTGITGAVSASNSLVGSTASDNIGAGITALTNGNYVVRSALWDGTAVDVGAATWGSGTTGITAAVSASNSLVGSTAGDQVSLFGVTALTNGNYVVRITSWDGAAADAGAVTWGNGTTGITAAVSASNSLVGSTASDFVGFFGVTALTNGNYVVSSPAWDGAAVDSGAVTLSSGPTSGTISAANSVLGTAASGGSSMNFRYDYFNDQLVVGRPADNIVTLFTTAPTVDTFTITAPSSSVNIPVTAFTASDNTGVTGYLITTSATAPLAAATGWSATAPTTYTVAGDGSYTLYPWVKDAAGNVSAVFGTPRAVTVTIPAATVLVNSVLPTSRSVLVNTLATIFNTVLNAGATTATGVTLSISPAPAGVFAYQQTNCATNAIIGGLNPSLDVDPGQALCYVLSFTPSEVFPATSVHIRAQAANAPSTNLLPGINTWLLRSTAIAGPDIIALTTTTDFHQVACSGINAFAVATANVGAAATGNITVSANTGSASLPVTVLIQETDPATGAVIGTDVLSNVTAGQNRTVAVFVVFNGCIPFDPAVNRIFIEFKDGDGNVVGSTSTAVSTGR